MPDLRAIRQPRPRWIVTTNHVIPPAAELAMAQHVRPASSRADASHLSMLSRPAAVTRLIVAAAAAPAEGQRVVMVDR